MYWFVKICRRVFSSALWGAINLHCAVNCSHMKFSSSMVVKRIFKRQICSYFVFGTNFSTIEKRTYNLNFICNDKTSLQFTTKKKIDTYMPCKKCPKHDSSYGLIQRKAVTCKINSHASKIKIRHFGTLKLMIYFFCQWSLFVCFTSWF